MTMFSMKDPKQNKLIKKIPKLDLMGSVGTTSTNFNWKALTQRCESSDIYSVNCNKKADTQRLNKSKKSIKPMIGSSHERSKSSVKNANHSIIQASESLKRSLINFKSDLLGLKHGQRYSAETENLVQLIQKYTERIYKIETKFKLNSTDKSGSRTTRVGGNSDQLSAEQYFENENFEDIILEKNNKIKKLNKECLWYVHFIIFSLTDQNKDLMTRIAELEDQNEIFQRKLQINDKHVEIEHVFSKLSSLLMANRMDENLDLKFNERRMIKDLFGGMLTFFII